MNSVPGLETVNQLEKRQLCKRVQVCQCFSEKTQCFVVSGLTTKARFVKRISWIRNSKTEKVNSVSGLKTVN